jgi:hexokinase
MKMLKAKVNQFLKKYQMNYDGIDIAEGCDTFIQEMRKGLDGEQSTLKMLCTYISDNDQIPTGEPVIVMDAGGTNFRVAVARLDNNKQAVIEDFKVYPMPGTKGAITKEEFFQTIVQYLEPVIHKSDKIGFCFSYPAEMLPDKDGRLIRFSKEVQVTGMEGVVIGAGLIQALQDNGITTKKKIVLLNDTVATLLGGKAAYPNRKFDSYIGFILGTGINTCYIEANREIRKALSLIPEAGKTLINIESGGYGKAPRGVIDEEFDHLTVNPGDQQFEKMISGAYQGGLLLEIIRKAIAEGLFSRQFANRLCQVDCLAAKDIDDFCFYPYADDNTLSKCVNVENFDSDTDRLTLYYIIDAVLERAARLVAINLAAVMLKTGKGQNPCLPVCITAEGTTFNKSKLFRSKLDYYVKAYLNEKMGIYCEFTQVDNVTLIGTAIAGLLG